MASIDEITFGRALELVASAVEYRARFLAGRYSQYREAEELRMALRKVKEASRNPQTRIQAFNN